MNNKGQVLVMLVIILPILLLILTFTIDYGLLSVEKRKLQNNTYEALEYYLDNYNDDNIYDKTIKLLETNLNDVEISIKDTDDYVEIEVKNNYKNLYSKIMNEDLNIKYIGLKTDKKIIKG